jgi:organic radical activating enzyme
MTCESNFLECLENEFAELLTSEKPVIIFGASILGQMAVTVLNHYYKKIAFICDNDIQKQGTLFCGIEVLSPENALEELNDAVVYVCVYNYSNFNMIAAQLVQLGYKNVRNKDVLFWLYQTKIMNRAVSAKKLAKAMEIVKFKEDFLTLGNVSVVITEKCTLRCIDCGVLIPYYKKPKHHDKKFVIKSIQRLASSVDVIENLTIIGGEPFLHEDFAEICQEASTIDNIMRITATTNGTVMLDEKTLSNLKSSLLSITISDYGEYSRKKEELKQRLKEKGICYDVLAEESPWSKQNMPVAQNRDKFTNDEIYKNCFWVKTAGKLMNGQYHLCDFSAAMTPFSGIPNNESDYIDLMDNVQSAMELRQKMKQLLSSSTCLKACDYCLIYTLPETERAKQTKDVLVFEGAK